MLINLIIKKDRENSSISVNGNIAIDKRELQTSVLVEDDDLLVKNKIPFFSDLPLIGVLFINSAKINKKKELLIFVTPKIVKDNHQATQ
ncbi:MAG: hypothetical protein EXR89_01955 [Methylococcaceae bacterium]|nr:hypothetical protein [Methylococcaceae bacterium]